MEQGLADSLTENHNILFNYLTHESWTRVVKGLAWCAASRTPPSTDTPLDDLVKISMLQKEERLERSLSRFNFLLDTPEALRLVIDSGRIEKVVSRDPWRRKMTTDLPSSGHICSSFCHLTAARALGCTCQREGYR